MIRRARQRTTPVLIDVLRRYPRAPAGKNRVAQLMKTLDSTLRTPYSAAQAPPRTGQVTNRGTDRPTRLRQLTPPSRGDPAGLVVSLHAYPGGFEQNTSPYELAASYRTVAAHKARFVIDSPPNLLRSDMFLQHRWEPYCLRRSLIMVPLSGFFQKRVSPGERYG